MVIFTLNTHLDKLPGHGLRVVPRLAIHYPTATVLGPVHLVIHQTFLLQGNLVIELILAEIFNSSVIK